MNRLTAAQWSNHHYHTYANVYPKRKEMEPDFQRIIDKLGQLEDILYAPDDTPRISLERLKELVDADAEGRITIGKSVEEIEYDKFLDDIEYIACTYCPIRIFCSENSSCVHTCRDMAKLYYKSRVSAEAAKGEQS